MSSVSVVMAVYNGNRFLQKQIDSIVAQLLPGDELIVIDDASTDGSLASLRKMPSGPLQVHVNPANVGVLKTFERGLQLARHEFVFLSDQDDLWKDGKRAAYVAEFLRDPRVSVVISDAQVIDGDGQLQATSFMASRKGFSGTLLGTLWRNRYLGCAMALRRSVLDAALPIPAGVPMHDMWLGAVGNLVGRVVYLPTPYLQYRRHDSNVSPSRRQSVRRMIGWRAALLSAILGRLAALAVRKRRRRAVEMARQAAPKEGNR